MNQGGETVRNRPYPVHNAGVVEWVLGQTVEGMWRYWLPESMVSYMLMIY